MCALLDSLLHHVYRIVVVVDWVVGIFGQLSIETLLDLAFLQLRISQARIDPAHDNLLLQPRPARTF